MKKGEPIKNAYNRETLTGFAKAVQSVFEPFQADAYVDAVMDDTWDELELSGRWLQITKRLGEYLPSDYKQAIAILDKVAPLADDWFGIIFPYFVDLFGQDPAHWDISIPALARYTVYSSSEFAVRPFIINHEERMMAQMFEWSKDECEHLRRLASEGCRPALPWSQALPKYKEDPTPVLPILEQLKADPSRYVQKSVANNLNDISKTHPELVVEIAEKWLGKDKNTDWIVKHACRTLLKQGNRDALALFGFFDGTAIELKDFALSAKSTSLGSDIGFSFAVTTDEPTKLRLEYAIDFMKANGKQSRKVFQISESELKAGELRSYDKKHSFADLSTRKHYPGAHAITLIINGAERETLDFELLP